MSRKERLAAKHAAGRGKGRSTPKNTPGGMTRKRLHRLNARSSERAVKNVRDDRAVETLRFGDEQERIALEQLLREAGGLILAPKEQ